MLRARLMARKSSAPVPQPRPPPGVPPHLQSQQQQAVLLGEADGAEVVAPIDARGRVLRSLYEERGEGDEVVMQKEDMRKGRKRGFRKTANPGEEAAQMGIDAMVEEERRGGRDMDEDFARNIMRLGSNYKGTEAHAGSRSGFDEEEEVDMKMFERREDKMTAMRRQERDKQVAVNEHKKWMAMMQTNPFSMENPKFKQHLVIVSFRATLHVRVSMRMEVSFRTLPSPPPTNGSRDVHARNSWAGPAGARVRHAARSSRAGGRALLHRAH